MHRIGSLPCMVAAGAASSKTVAMGASAHAQPAAAKHRRQVQPRARFGSATELCSLCPSDVDTSALLAAPSRPSSPSLLCPVAEADTPASPMFGGVDPGPMLILQPAHTLSADASIGSRNLRTPSLTLPSTTSAQPIRTHGASARAADPLGLLDLTPFSYPLHKDPLDSPLSCSPASPTLLSASFTANAEWPLGAPCASRLASATTAATPSPPLAASAPSDSHLPAPAAPDKTAAMPDPGLRAAEVHDAVIKPPAAPAAPPQGVHKLPCSTGPMSAQLASGQASPPVMVRVYHTTLPLGYIQELMTSMETLQSQLPGGLAAFPMPPLFPPAFSRPAQPGDPEAATGTAASADTGTAAGAAPWHVDGPSAAAQAMGVATGLSLLGRGLGRAAQRVRAAAHHSPCLVLGADAWLTVREWGWAEAATLQHSLADALSFSEMVVHDLLRGRATQFCRSAAEDTWRPVGSSPTSVALLCEELGCGSLPPVEPHMGEPAPPAAASNGADGAPHRLTVVGWAQHLAGVGEAMLAAAGQLRASAQQALSLAAANGGPPTTPSSASGHAGCAARDEPAPVMPGRMMWAGAA